MRPMLKVLHFNSRAVGEDELAVDRNFLAFVEVGGDDARNRAGIASLV